jgi:hypothetical protein
MDRMLLCFDYARILPPRIRCGAEFVPSTLPLFSLMGDTEPIRQDVAALINMPPGATYGDWSERMLDALEAAQKNGDAGGMLEVS